MKQIKKRSAQIAITGFVAAGMLSPLYGVSWIGGVAGDWNVAGNWSPAGVPGGGDFLGFSGAEGAVIGSGVTAETWRMNLQRGNVGGGTTATLTIQAGGSLTTGVLPNGGSIAGMNLNWGGNGGSSGAAINIVGGSLVSQTVRTPGASAAGQDITLAISAGGSASMTTLDLDGTGAGYGRFPSTVRVRR